MSILFCDRCQASLTGEALFCGNCGAPTPHGREVHAERQRGIRQQMAARGTAIGLVFVGSLLGMVGVGLGFHWLGVSLQLTLSAIYALDLAICTAALWRLGPAAFRHSFGRAPDGQAILLGIAVPLLSLVVAYAYVGLAPGEAPDDDLGWSIPVALFFIAVMPALVEEWMCRGVLWVAVRPITTGGITIFSTAALFAFLHGLNGGFIAEFPHRFVMGLLLGWLRARTGSLWPCVLAHFLHNGFVVVQDGT